MNKTDHFQANRQAARDATVAALRDGRKNRAWSIPNKKKEASRKACRGGFQ
jgi:hypothetical protein